MPEQIRKSLHGSKANRLVSLAALVLFMAPFQPGRNLLPQAVNAEASPWLKGFSLVGTLLFGLRLLGAIPIPARLLIALIRGAVKWPGPALHDPGPAGNRGSLHFGLRPQRLFSAYGGYFGGLAGAFIFFLFSFLSTTPLLAGQLQIRLTWEWFIVIPLTLFAGWTCALKTSQLGEQVKRLLGNLTGREEPRQIDGTSAEAEYAIEHPLVEHPPADPAQARAMLLFSESTKYFQGGERIPAQALYQDALGLDPSLHEHARLALSGLVQDCSPLEAGPVYYWLGAHSEYLHDLRQAAGYYEKAIAAFSQAGYQKRESRAHCNLGNVKMQMHDGSGMEEFEKAVALNPRNGTAHINIANVYYSVSYRSGPRYELALDAYANAIVADPLTYGPQVIASLRRIGYTWQEDLEKITQRVESKRRNAAGQG